MILKIIRWIFGYVIFEINSKDIKNFLNLIKRLNVRIWDIDKINNVMSAKVNLVEYKNLSNIAKRNNIKLTMIGQIGCPLIYNTHKNRKGILLGIFLFFLTIHAFSFYIWKINVIGIENLNKQTVINKINENGILVGSLKKKINTQVVNQNLMAMIPDVSWVSVNIEGCIANVYLKEKIKTPDIENSQEAQDIKALCDAQIIRMETFSGTPLVKPGDAVIKDQILVSSHVIDSQNIISNVYANANVWGKIGCEITEKEDLKQIAKIKTGNKKEILKFFIFGKEFNINFWESIDKNWKKEKQLKTLNILGLELPIKYGKEKFYEWNEVKIKITKEEALESAKKRAYEKLNIEYNDNEILEKFEDFTINEENVIFRLKIQCIKNISVPKKINQTLNT